MSEKETLNLGDEVSRRNLQKIDPFFQGLVAEVLNRCNVPQQRQAFKMVAR